MCQLFETIRIFEGKPLNLNLHNERMNRSRQILLGKNDELKLEKHINVPDNAKEGIFRCRIIYADSVISVEFTPYFPAIIKTLKTVEAGYLVYDHKYLDRSSLISLIDKTIADDILIIRNGCITDTSFTNIVFSDGHRWLTPDTPLLPGTMRELLIRQGLIKTSRIKLNDIYSFSHFRLINSMLGNEGPLHPVSFII